MTTIKAVLFDLDGTLLDSIDGILSSFGHVLKRHVPHKNYTRQELIMTIGEPLAVQMRSFADQDEAMALRMVDDYRVHNLALLPNIPLYPEVHETILALRARGFKTGLVTSKGRDSASISLDGHGLRPLFDLVMTADDTSKHKPDPMPLVVAAQRLGLEPSAMVYVGDSVHDLRCAQAAGSVDIAALWGPFLREDLAALQPQYMIESLPELLALPLLARPA